MAPSINITSIASDDLDDEDVGGMAWDSAPESDDPIIASALALADTDLTEDVDGDGFPVEHDANLAEYVDESTLRQISQDLLSGIQNDLSSMSSWLEVAGRGIKEMGFDRQKDQRSDPFPGASGVTHPAMAKASVDFMSRALPEMCPPNGPVRIKEVGEYNPTKDRKAQVVREHMNYQLTVQIPEYRESTAAMLMMLAPVGTWFKKVFWNEIKGRVDFVGIAPGDLIVNMRASDLDNAERVTHSYQMTRREFEKMQELGAFRDIFVMDDDDMADDTGANGLKDAIEQIVRAGEGYSTISSDIDGCVRLYEVRCMLDIESEAEEFAFGDEEDEPDDDSPADSGAFGQAGEEIEPGEDVGAERAKEMRPYIVTLDANSGAIVSIKRNWDQEDPRKRQIMPIFAYKFVSWSGFFGLGLYHLIGGLQSTLTGATRALLDSAQIQNAGGGLRLKGARLNGGDKSFSPLDFVEVECDMQDTPDINKLFSLIPRTPPSEVLYRLLEMFGQQAEAFAGIATQTIADMGGNTPATTMLALIEQGSKSYAAIHAGLHFTQGRELREMHRLNGLYLNDGETVRTHGGEMVVRREDYDASIDIIPVSDPNIFSDAQRAAQAQAVMQMAQQYPQLINLEEALKDYLTTLRVPSPDRFLVQQKQPKPLDPVSEFQAIIAGEPTDAFQGQDHQAHVAYLTAVSQDPQYQIVMQAAGPLVQALIARHLGLQALDEAIAFAQQQAQQAQMMGQMVPPPDPRQLAQLQAQAAQQQSQQRQQIAAQQAQQAQQQGDGMSQALMADVQRKAQADVAEAELKAQKLQVEIQKNQLDQQVKAFEAERKSQIDMRALEMEYAFKADQAARDRELQLTIESMKIAQQQAVTGPIGQTEGDATDGKMPGWFGRLLGR